MNGLLLLLHVEQLIFPATNDIIWLHKFFKMSSRFYFLYTVLSIFSQVDDIYTKARRE